MALTRRIRGQRHGVAAEELDGPFGRVQMVVAWLAGGGSPPVVGARAMQRIGEPQGRFHAERECNVLHTVMEVTLPEL